MSEDKVEILTEDYLDFYRQHPPAWVKDEQNSISKLEKWLLLEKAGKRAYHDHDGNMRLHPVAVKNHEEWFKQNFGGQEQQPKQAQAAKDSERERFKNIATEGLQADFEQIKRIIDGQQLQYDNGLRRLQQLKADALIAKVNNDDSELSRLNEKILAEDGFRDRQQEIILGLYRQHKSYVEELAKREKKKTRTPKVKFQYDSPEESAIGTSPTMQRSNLGGGANRTDIIVLKNGKKAVFKPASGEAARVRKDIKVGTYFKREVAAYQLAKIMGLERYVPVTVLRKEKAEIGSAQEFVEGPYEDPFSEWPSQVDPEHIYNCAFFDTIIGNEDRHRKNVLVRSSNKFPILIDHGLAFPNGTIPSWPRSVFIKYLQSKLQNPKLTLHPDHQKKLQELIADELKIRRKLASFLEENAIDGLFQRIRTMKDTNDYSLGILWEN